jgi:phosphatidylglycerophosphatase A
MAERLRPNLSLLLSSPTMFLALGAGTGLVPYAPGTAGSLLAVPAVLLLQMLPFWWQAVVWALMTGAGFWICDRAGRALGDPDHPAIVWDEICGTAIVLLLAPPGVGWLLAGLVAFRVFDIAKPWPISVIDRRTTRGAETMADDLLAAAYALAAVFGLHALISVVLGID